VTAHIDYLEVVSAEKARAAAKLTAGIADWVLRLERGRVAKNPQDVIDEFVDGACASRQKESKSDPSAFSLPPWDETITLDIEYQSARVLSLSCARIEYTGGAHGQESTSFANFRPPTGEPIRLTDIFKEGFAAPLNAVGERRFREMNGLSPQDSLKEADFNFPNNLFQLNQNFSIGAHGLTYYFQLHEITSDNSDYKLLLPYEDLQKLLRPDAGIP
jgi:hypothetical protein